MKLRVTGPESSGFTYMRENFDLEERLKEPFQNGQRFVLFTVKLQFGPEEYQAWCAKDPSGRRARDTSYIHLTRQPDHPVFETCDVIAFKDPDMAWQMALREHGLMCSAAFGLLELEKDEPGPTPGLRRDLRL